MGMWGIKVGIGESGWKQGNRGGNAGNQSGNARNRM